MSSFDENGFIGMDPVLAKKNIDDFSRAMYQIYIKFSDAICNLFEELYYAWVSPNAVEFYDKYALDCENVRNDIIKSTDAICQGAFRSYNVMARATGNPVLTDDYANEAFATSVIDFDDFTKLISNKAGKSGINRTYAKNILDAFNVTINDIYSLLDAVPSSIALYDYEDSQSGAFSTGISNMRTKIESLVSDIKTKINEAIMTEVDNILLAKQQSTDAMTNMNG